MNSEKDRQEHQDHGKEDHHHKEHHGHHEHHHHGGEHGRQVKPHRSSSQTFGGYMGGRYLG